MTPWSTGRTPLLVGTSWKMSKTLTEARDYAEVLASARFPDHVVPFVLPSHTALALVSGVLPADGPVRVGAQDAHWATDPAHTGEVSMRMVRDAGATLVAIGHPERRSAGETDEMVAAKVRAAADEGLTPLLCVGETRAQHDSGGAHRAVAGQLDLALSGLGSDVVARTIVAYEPVWAIGDRGVVAAPDRVAAMATWIRRVCGRPPAAVLYGGSVDRDTAPSLIRDGAIDGVFVGRAAWDPARFLELVGICAEAVHGRSPPGGAATVPVTS